MEKSENLLKLLLNIFFSQKKIFFWTAFTSVVLTLLVAFFYPPVYLLTGSLIVKSKKMQLPPEMTSEGLSSRLILPPSSEDILSETRIINEDLIRHAISQIDPEKSLIEEPGVVISLLKKYVTEPIENYVTEPIENYVTEPIKRRLNFIGALNAENEISETEALIQDIYANLSVVILPGSNIIDLQLTYADPIIGKLILNSMLDNYLLYRLELFTDKNENSFFLNQVNSYRKKIDQLESEKIALLDQASTSNVEITVSSQIDIIKTIEKDLINIEAEYFEKKRNLEYLTNLLKSYLNNVKNEHFSFPYRFEDPEIQQYIEKINSLQFDYSDSLNTYQSDSPKISLMRQHIDDLKSNLIYLIRNKITQLEYETETVRQIIEQRKKKRDDLHQINKALKELQFRLERINAEIDMNNENYQTFNQKLEESSIERASEMSHMANVQILQRASVPMKEFFPYKPVVIPIGIFTGILLGLSLGLIGGFFDHTFRTPDHVQRYLDLPVIGSVLDKKL